MAAKKKPAAVVPKTKPAFPYTTRPAALRKFLTEVPKRPKPPKVNGELLGSWGLSGGENQTIIRVLKTVGLLNAAGEPTDQYISYMQMGAGPAVMAQLVRSVYRQLFTASHEPHREQQDALRNLFNIHSGGAPGTIDFQIQTFKALCDYADFGASAPVATNGAPIVTPSAGARADVARGGQTSAGAEVHIDLHIHLPPDKSARDYEYIIQDIAKYIFGRSEDRRGDDR